MPTIPHTSEAKNETKTPDISDTLMARLKKEKVAAFDFQKRRFTDWNDNYELYRNKVRLNRLTQRQAVNIPLMKETIKTLLSGVDDPPSITFKEKGGDAAKEIIMQERWNDDYKELNFEGVDVQDKKTVLLYGRGFKKLNFLDDDFSINALDIYDVVIDPLTDPLNLESARYIIHQNIFRSLREVLANPRYTKKGKEKLKIHLSSTEGIIQSEDNQKALDAQRERLKAMGVEDKDFAHFASGDVLLNLSEHYTLIWDKKKKEFVRYVVVYANDEIRLLKEPLKTLLGVDFYPFVTWGEDIETQDFWSDGPADLVRTPNKVLNIWLSQMIENRTLKNFQMSWYDSTKENYQPQTYDPGPGKMLPAPGDPNKTIKPVEVSGLDDTMNQIDFLIKLVEKGTSATSIEKGQLETKQVRVAEIELAVGKAMERTMSMAKFYRRSWEELASKWYQILAANDGKVRTLYKTSAKGELWPREVKPTDWKSKKGYIIQAQSTSEAEAEKINGLKKMLAIQQQFPNNPVLNRILQRRSLELIDLTADELREVEEYEKKKLEAPPIAPQVLQQGGEEKQVLGNIMQGVDQIESAAQKV